MIESCVMVVGLYMTSVNVFLVCFEVSFLDGHKFRITLSSWLIDSDHYGMPFFFSSEAACLKVYFICY